MFSVEVYAKIRRAVLVDGMTRRAASRLFGVHRNTIAKMLAYPVPPGYRRKTPRVSVKLEGFTEHIDAMLESDRSMIGKQRHTCKRVFDRLREEHHYTGGLTIVHEYVRSKRRRMQEVFVPLSHRPGHAQADFGEADALLGGKRVRVYYLCIDIPHSDACFVKAYLGEVAEAWCDGHVDAFTFFGGVPLSILYDNSKRLVAQILGDGRRVRATLFSELQSHYLFKDKFGRPAKGNDKGKVEGLVGFARRNFMVPMPVADDIDALNAKLMDKCTKRQQAVLRGQTLSIGERLKADQAVFMPLPAVPYDPCHKVPGRVSSMSLVRYRTNDYSVPTVHAYQDVLIKGYVDRVEIICGGARVAVHARSYEREDFIADPLHYLALIERKPRALDQAAPLDKWLLSEDVHRMRRLMETRQTKEGRREFIQVLRLCEHFEQHMVEAAVSDALKLRVISFDAIKLLLLARLERKPARLDLTLYPYLPRATVATTDSRDYMQLLGVPPAPAAMQIGAGA